MKKGDSVVVSKGTPISWFQGSVLDKDPFVRSKIEYNCLGKIVDINKLNIAIQPWHHNSPGNSGIINVPAKNKKCIKPTEFILGWNEKLGVMTVFHPAMLPADGSREYVVKASRQTGNKGETMSWTVWAISRSDAISKFADSVISMWGAHQSVKMSAKLRWKRQPPFIAKDLKLK